MGGALIPVPEGNDSWLRAFVDTLRTSGIEANLEEVNEMARSHGWDGESFANIGDLGRLCRQFEVGLILEHHLTRCLRCSGPSGISLFAWHIWIISNSGGCARQVRK